MPQYCRISLKPMLVGILAMYFSGPVMAQQKTGPSCPERPITLGVYEYGNFYHAGTGLDKDIAEQMAARSGCKIALRTMIRAQIWGELQAGSLDMTLSAAATPERTTFAWATPYLWMKNSIILSKSVDPNIHSIADFIAAPNLRIGVARGYYSGKPYDEFIAQLRNIARVEEVSSTEQLYAMFKAGRFQAMVGAPLVYSNYLKDDQARIEDWSLSTTKESANLLISKKNFSKEEAKRWGELIKAIANDGTLLRLVERYAPPVEAAKMLVP